MKKSITKSECSALRGIAILAIMLHNYCHWFAFAIKENEYTYHSYYNHYLWEHLFRFDKNAFIDLFSFFGHYGVPIFLFISGYGLVMKYEQKGKIPPALPFIIYHYLKLFRLMIIGFITFIFVYWITEGEFAFTFWKIIGQLTMLINMSSDPDGFIKPGPYWYFGLMLQLYVIYRMLLFRHHWSIILSAVIICWLAQAFCSPTSGTLNWLRYNAIGSVMPFCTGIIFARYGHGYNHMTYLIAAVISIAAIYLFGYAYQLWLWIPLFIVTVSVSIIKLLPAQSLHPLVWIGDISAAIFVIHPIMRPIFITISQAGYVYTGLIAYVTASIVVACLYKHLLKFIPKPKLKL